VLREGNRLRFEVAFDPDAQESSAWSQVSHAVLSVYGFLELIQQLLVTPSCQAIIHMHYYHHHSPIHLSLYKDSMVGFGTFEPYLLQCLP